MAALVSQVGHHRLSCRLGPYCRACAPARLLRWATIWADNVYMPIASLNMIASGRIRRGNVYGVALALVDAAACGETRPCPCPTPTCFSNWMRPAIPPTPHQHPSIESGTCRICQSSRGGGPAMANTYGCSHTSRPTRSCARSASI